MGPLSFYFFFSLFFNLTSFRFYLKYLYIYPFKRSKTIQKASLPFLRRLSLLVWENLLYSYSSDFHILWLHHKMKKVLDEGSLSGSRGESADFRSTIIFMTSNLGAKESFIPLQDFRKDTYCLYYFQTIELQFEK